MSDPPLTPWTTGQFFAWQARGLDQRVNMPAIGVTLQLAEVYDGVVFPARPRLVRREDPER